MIDITEAGRSYKDKYLKRYGVPETEASYAQAARRGIPLLAFLDFSGPQDENERWWQCNPSGTTGFLNDDRKLLTQLFEAGYIEKGEENA